MPHLNMPLMKFEIVSFCYDERSSSLNCVLCSKVQNFFRGSGRKSKIFLFPLKMESTPNEKNPGHASGEKRIWLRFLISRSQHWDQFDLKRLFPEYLISFVEDLQDQTWIFGVSIHGLQSIFRLFRFVRRLNLNSLLIILSPFFEQHKNRG
jgi:hypothetical protein